MEGLFNAIGGAAQAKEWGLIILLIVVFVVLIRSVMASLAQRDRAAGEREERLIKVMIGFGDAVPRLANAIDGLKNWLEIQLSDVNSDLDVIKDGQAAISDMVDEHDKRIEDHEKRIGDLEHSDDEPITAVTAAETTATKKNGSKKGNASKKKG